MAVPGLVFRSLCSSLRSVTLSKQLLNQFRFPQRRWASMKAAVLNEFSQPLKIQEVKVPKKLKKKEVLIRVHYCGVNASDILICQGLYDSQPKLPFIPGFEASGVVEAVGTAVTDFKPGDHVVTLNKEQNGGFAEICIAPDKDTWKLPSSVSFEMAAGMVDSYATAYLALSRRANITPEDTVLVTAAAGGLGLAAIDLAANVYKAKVIGICDTEDKADLVRQKGAWSALKYNKENMIATVKDISKNKGTRVVLEAVGGDVFLDALECVSHEGCVIVAGFASRRIPNIPTSVLLPQSCSLIGVSMTHYREADNATYQATVEEVLKMAEEGLLDPHISETYNLEKVNEALKFVEERKSTGKVLLKIQ